MQLDPLMGRPNPELQQIAPAEKLMLAVASVGAAVLVGTLVYLATGLL